ncbi:mitochondrial PGP phosphatase-domain-containing protein [Kockiozyma suomiensis]|uniref:mitochondrial PGP phosphatase-domain-containing protein n=1 Tax=Kockiozyma suomiensis TaxID=1337062 RepID=UPI0033436056
MKGLSRNLTQRLLQYTDTVHNWFWTQHYAARWAYLRFYDRRDAAVQVLTLPYSPWRALPHARVNRFCDLPRDFSSLFPKHADIRAIILDKDNCFAETDKMQTHPENITALENLRRQFPGSRIFIVSNTAGAFLHEVRHALGINLRLKEETETATGIRVHEHLHFKPHESVGKNVLMSLIEDESTGVKAGYNVAVVGDRIFTDVLMANQIGAWAVWIEDGVKPSNSLLVRLEKRLIALLESRGVKPRLPVAPPRTEPLPPSDAW